MSLLTVKLVLLFRLFPFQLTDEVFKEAEQVWQILVKNKEVLPRGENYNFSAALLITKKNVNDIIAKIPNVNEQRVVTNFVKKSCVKKLYFKHTNCFMVSFKRFNPLFLWWRESELIYHEPNNSDQFDDKDENPAKCRMSPVGKYTVVKQNNPKAHWIFVAYRMHIGPPS